MRRIMLLAFLLNLAMPVFAQYANPNVQWSYSTKKIGTDQFDLIVTANIAKGYHLYSQFIGEGGPIPTSFTFEKTKGYKLVGKVKESGKREEAVEPLFDNMMLIWFEEQAVFTQRVKLTATEATVKGLVNFMTCNDQMCDPPSDQEFEFVLAGIPAADTVAAGSVA